MWNGDNSIYHVKGFKGKAHTNTKKPYRSYGFK